MDTKKLTIQRDKETILSLGGATKVAELLHYDTKSGGAQRVQNWLTRGIPAEVKLERPDLFLADLKFPKPKKAQKAARP